MRSRKPDTRATMLTWRELSVCATKLAVTGMFCGCTVMTVTSGTGRCGFGALLRAAGGECRDDGGEPCDGSY